MFKKSTNVENSENCMFPSGSPNGYAVGHPLPLGRASPRMGECRARTTRLISGSAGILALQPGCTRRNEARAWPEQAPLSHYETPQKPSTSRWRGQGCALSAEEGRRRLRMLTGPLQACRCPIALRPKPVSKPPRTGMTGWDQQRRAQEHFMSPVCLRIRRLSIYPL